MTDQEWAEGVMAFMQANPQLTQARQDGNAMSQQEREQMMMTAACTYAKSLPTTRWPLGLVDRMAECSAVGVPL